MHDDIRKCHAKNYFNNFDDASLLSFYVCQKSRIIGVYYEI
jgi:hypothetical protein